MSQLTPLHDTSAAVRWGQRLAILLAALLLWGGLATAPIFAQTAQLQLIHNAAGFGDVDIYVLDSNGNQEAKLDDVPFRGALVFDVPAEQDLTVTVNGSGSSGSGDAQVASVSPINLSQDSFNQAFAVGENASDFEVLLKPGQSTTASSGTVGLLVGHQSPDAGAVDVLTRGILAADGFSYKDFAPSASDTYVPVPADNYIIRVGPDDNSSFVGSFSAPLQDLGLGGSTLTVLASGFLNPPNSGDPSLGVIAVPPVNTSTSADEIAEAGNADENVTVLPAAPSPQPLVINEFLANPASGDDPNGDGSAGGDSEEEFVEVVNNTGGTVDLGGYEIVDDVGNTYTFPQGVSVPDGEAATIFAGGTPTDVPGVTDTGLPALNNGGDDIILRDGDGNTLDQVTYGTAPFAPSQEGESTTRSPDFTGPMVLSSSVGPAFTPGQTNDGSTNLPVELAGFAARLDGSDAVLTWRTLSERNNSGFAVQHRAGEEGAFEQVGFREGQGSTSEATSYRFRVADLRPGPHDFRLKQVDVDGSTSLTDVVTVEVALDEAFAWTRVAPTPVAGTGTLSMQVRETQEVTVELYDLLGRRVRTVHNGALQSGRRHRLSLDAGGLAGGAYLLRADGENFSDTQRVMIVK
ncbi:MAG: lamin tail domain-containing protein [Salinivenus sp.]